MTVHPDDQRLRDFAAGALPPADLLEVDDHLSACGACRARAARLAGAAGAFDEFRAAVGDGGGHLTEDEAQLYATDQLPPGRVVELTRHVAECEVCRIHVGDLRRWARRSSRPAIRFAAAAAALIAILIPGAIWFAQQNRRQPAPALDVTASLSAAARAGVAAALRDGAARLPPFMADLTPPREVLMGPAAAQTPFAVVAPVGTAVVDDRPAFVWRPLPGTGPYVVTVFDEGGREVLRSPAVSDARWQAVSALPRGRTYTWQVTAERDDQVRIAPAAPAPPARFHLVDSAVAADLQRAAREHPDAHLVLGILYMDAGVREQAIAEFRQVPAEDPHALVARQALQQLENIR